MKLEQQSFGKLSDGAEVKIYTLSNNKGVTAKVTEYGGILTELWVPDRTGKPGNVVCGFDNLGPARRREGLAHFRQIVPDDFQHPFP